jgi:hypothetical protein
MSTDRTSSTGFDWLTKRNSDSETDTRAPSPVPEKDNEGPSEKDFSKYSKEPPRPSQRGTAKRNNTPRGKTGAAPKKGKTSKSRNPDYDLMGVYIRKEVRRQIDRALAARKASEEKVQYSDLVERLIVEWLDEQGFPPESEESENQ